MIAGAPTPRPSLRDYNLRLARNCPMSVTRWRKIKGVLYSLILGSVAGLSMFQDADPTLIGSITILGIMLFFGLELKEVEIASFLTLTFKNGKKRK